MVGSRHRRLSPVVAYSLLLSLAHAEGAPPVAYARLALPPDGQQVLLLKLRSDGQCKVRNVLVADTNFNGQFEPGEKQLGKLRTRKESKLNYTHCAFSPIVVKLPSGEVTGVNEVTVYAYRIERPKLDPEEQMPVMIKASILRQGERWDYQLATDITPSTSMNAKPRGFGGELPVQVQTRPDRDKPWQTGIAVLLGGEVFGAYQIMKDGQPCRVSLKVTDDKGVVVHQNTVDMSKLAFG
jgi:hypothetical protein